MSLLWNSDNRPYSRQGLLTQHNEESPKLILLITSAFTLAEQERPGVVHARWNCLLEQAMLASLMTGASVLFSVRYFNKSIIKFGLK